MAIRAKRIEFIENSASGSCQLIVGLTSPSTTAKVRISVLAKDVPGEGVEKFVKDDFITTGPRVPNRWRRHIPIEDLLLDRRPSPPWRRHFPVREVVGGCSGHQSKPYYQSG